MTLRIDRRLSIAKTMLAASLAAAGLATPSRAAPRQTAVAVCPQTGADRAEVAGIDERLDIALKDGRIVHLAGIDAPRPTPQSPQRDSEARDALLAELRGHAITLVPVAQKLDRWGRTPAFVFAAGMSETSVGLFLLRNGLARVNPQAEIHACRKAWLAAEAAARTAALGLWADPYYAVIAADDLAAFAEKAATDVIVEGRLKAAVRGKAGLRLEFATKGGVPKSGLQQEGNQRFSVIILQRNLRIFDQADMKFETLIGRSLRVRGLLDMRYGPQIEIAHPDEIEVAEKDDKAQLEIGANRPEAIPPKDP
jgi:endonuclease YncB( thermonuclease family)